MPPVHAWPHAPQFFVSDVRSTQAAGQSVRPLLHRHTPSAQVAPGLQVTGPHGSPPPAAEPPVDMAPPAPPPTPPPAPPPTPPPALLPMPPPGPAPAPPTAPPAVSPTMTFPPHPAAPTPIEARTANVNARCAMPLSENMA